MFNYLHDIQHACVLHVCVYIHGSIIYSTCMHAENNHIHMCVCTDEDIVCLIGMATSATLAPWDDRPQTVLE